MKNGLSRLKEEFPADAMRISIELGKALWMYDHNVNNQNSLNQLISTYFSRPETSGFLDGAIVYLDADKERFHVPSTLAVTLGLTNALRIILKHTRNPNARVGPDDPDGSPTLLMQSLIGDQFEVAELLLEEGANVNEEWIILDEEGRSCFSALSIAVGKGLAKTTNLLLDHGAIPKLYPAREAIEKNGGLNPLLVRMIELRPELLHETERSSGSGIESWSLLHFAAVRKNLPSIKWLLEQGASVNSVTDEGKTPFDFADEQANKEIAKFLQSVGGVSGKREEPEALQNPSATKQEITNIIERLELLEEKFGIAISGLYATSELKTWRTPHYHEIKLNFDVASSTGAELDRSFSIQASAYNSAGQLMETTLVKIYKDDFLGFASMSIQLHVDQAPEKIRLFPAV